LGLGIMLGHRGRHLCGRCGGEPDAAHGAGGIVDGLIRRYNRKMSDIVYII
jgi:hypothetical protein